ncbi:MAG: ABC transporter substrate-binding protein [Anaerolineae bacterium]|nr:ABC transporter substrate-binding protein [Anaerolineae bacterium]
MQTPNPSDSRSPRHRSRLATSGLVIVISLLLTLVAGCASQPPDLQSIGLPMGYVANVQFSPFYMAQERGYFTAAGFDVTFDYRYETDGIQLVAAGETPFTIASGDQVIQARSMGLPVKAVAAWYQAFPVGIISLETRPLSSPADLVGLTIGIPETFGASYIGLRALLDVAGLTEDDIDLQAIGYAQLAALTNGTVDAVVVYANNEPAVLAEQGIAYNGVWAADYVSLVSAVIVSSDAYIADHPEETQRFVDAFLHGLQDVLADQTEAFEMSAAYIEGLEENAAVQRAVLERSVSLWETPTPGLMTASAWEQAQIVMRDAGMIDTTVPVDALYTNAFVQPAD